MSGKRTSGSSTSTPSVRNRTPKIQKRPLTPEVLRTGYDQPEVLSRPSNSRLAEVYKTEEFINEWANNVPFHVASNVLHLRRYRRLSQSKLAKEMGTSQSAIARIESGQENITLGTLQRLITSLKGRFHISISPSEYRVSQQRPWWELQLHTETPWTLVDCVSRRTTESDQLIIGLERKNEAHETATLTANAARLLPQSAGTSQTARGA